MIINILAMPVGTSTLFKNEIISFNENDFPFCKDGNLTFNGKIERENDCIVVEGKINFKAISVCHKCGSDARVSLEISINEILSQVQNDEFGMFYDGKNLNLGMLINEYVIVDFPSRILCKKSCKGLCPNCNINLNEENCKCMNNKVILNNPANPFNELNKLKQKLK